MSHLDLSAMVRKDKELKRIVHLSNWKKCYDGTDMDIWWHRQERSWNGRCFLFTRKDNLTKELLLTSRCELKPMHIKEYLCKINVQFGKPDVIYSWVLKEVGKVIFETHSDCTSDLWKMKTGDDKRGANIYIWVWGFFRKIKNVRDCVSDILTLLHSPKQLQDVPSNCHCQK